MGIRSKFLMLPKDLLTKTYRKPKVYLCETDKTRMAQLEVFDCKGSFKFNSLSELNFYVPRVYNNETNEGTRINPFYDKIEALRLIELEGFGYFEIQGPELVGNGIEEKKLIKTYSLEYVLSQKYLENFYVNLGTASSIEVIYVEKDEDGKDKKITPIVLYDPNNVKLSLLHLILEKVYGWKIGHVDPQLWTLTRQFEVDRESVYDFIMNEICEKFNCYVVFDTINNIINLYAESPTAVYPNCDGKTNTFTNGDPDRGIAPFGTIETVAVDGYKITRWSYSVANGIGTLVLEVPPQKGETVEVIGVDSTWETDVFVSFDNLSQEINVSYDADSIKTVLTVTYGDDNDIREVNLGLPYLTDLSYYYNVEWMGQKLYDKYTSYLEKANNSQSDYTKNSKKILEFNDYISYEEHRLSSEYTLVEDITAKTVGTYYVRHQNVDGVYYYSEVSLPSEYRIDTEYYANISTNLNETVVSNLYTVLKKYFYAYFNGKTEEIAGALDELVGLSDSFKFMKTYTITNLSDDLRSATTVDEMDTAIYRFLDEMWTEIGRTPLQELYLTPYSTIQKTDIEAGWSNKNDPNYGNYYPVVLLINSINTAIEDRTIKINKYVDEQKAYREDNARISNELLMSNYFNEEELIRLSSFLREDELHIDDIVETGQDDLTSSIKIKQDAMETGRIELKKLCEPQLQFSMTMANIYALPEFARIITQFQLGNIIRIKLRDMQTHNLHLIGDGTTTEFVAPLSFEDVKKVSFSNGKKIKYDYDPKIGKLIFETAPEKDVIIDVVFANYYIKQSRLLQVDINFDDFSDFSCEFGELTSLRTQSDIHADLLSQAITAGKSVATNSSYWTRGSNTASAIDLKIQQGLLDATTQIKAIDGNQGVVIDKYGIKLQKKLENGAIDPRQTWLVNNMILMSDDGFKTSRSALGELTVDGQTYYGLIAEMVLSGYIEGSIIKGGTIQIGESVDENGNKKYAFEVDKDGNVTMSSGSIKGYVTEDALKDVSDVAEKAASDIEALPGKISLSVTNGSVGNTASIVLKAGDNETSGSIDLTGAVSFSNLTDGVTTIDGANIKTGTIAADRIDADNLHVQAANIDGTLTADKIDVANVITIGGIAKTSDIKTKTSELTNDSGFQNETGVVTIINGTVDADYVKTLNLEVGNQISMGPNAKISWNNVTETSDVATKTYVTSQGYQTESQVTEITEDTISTTNVTAQNLKVNAAHVNGTLSAAEISASKITAGTNSVDITFNGNFIAPKATITGTITADYLDANSGGEIAGWTIDNNSMRIGTLGADNSMWLCNTGTSTSANIGTGSGNGWCIGVGSNFGVKKDGSLYASGVNISGHVDADSGNIGNWIIYDGNLVSDIVLNDPLYQGKSAVRLSREQLEWVEMGHDGYQPWTAEWIWVIYSARDWYSTNSDESDANVKNSISTFDSTYDNLFDNLSPCKYKYNHGTSDRFHTGFIAQEVVEAVENAGLTTQDFAGVIHLEEPNENGCEWLLRRDEFVALNTWQIQKLKKRIEELERKIEMQ